MPLLLLSSVVCFSSLFVCYAFLCDLFWPWSVWSVVLFPYDLAGLLWPCGLVCFGLLQSPFTRSLRHMVLLGPVGSMGFGIKWSSWLCKWQMQRFNECYIAQGSMCRPPVSEPWGPIGHMDRVSCLFVKPPLPLSSAFLLHWRGQGSFAYLAGVRGCDGSRGSQFVRL